MGAKMDFEAIFPQANRNLFHQCMIRFFNLLELNDQNYLKKITVGDENYNVKSLFFMKDIVPFRTDS